MRHSRGLAIVTLVLSLAVLFARVPLVGAAARVNPSPEIRLAEDVRLVNWYERISTFLPPTNFPSVVH